MNCGIPSDKTLGSPRVFYWYFEDIYSLLCISELLLFYILIFTQFFILNFSNLFVIIYICPFYLLFWYLYHCYYYFLRKNIYKTCDRGLYGPLPLVYSLFLLIFIFYSLDLTLLFLFLYILNPPPGDSQHSFEKAINIWNNNPSIEASIDHHTSWQ